VVVLIFLFCFRNTNRTRYVWVYSTHIECAPIICVRLAFILGTKIKISYIFSDEKFIIIYLHQLKCVIHWFDFTSIRLTRMKKGGLFSVLNHNQLLIPSFWSKSLWPYYSSQIKSLFHSPLSSLMYYLNLQQDR
jgi:hypothetical protein